MANTGKPILLSSGMSLPEELEEAVRFLSQLSIRTAIFQCTTAYPCPPERVGLDMIDRIRRQYNCPVGLSDHSGTIYAGLAAATLGVNLLEVHVTLSREMFGPDVCASVTTNELKQLVEGVRFIERAISTQTDKRAAAEEMRSLRSTFGKSLVARVDLPEGTVIDRDHLSAKKPGTGIPPSELGSISGRVLRRSIPANRPVTEDDLHPLSERSTTFGQNDDQDPKGHG